MAGASLRLSQIIFNPLTTLVWLGAWLPGVESFAFNHFHGRPTRVLIGFPLA
jgi:hypothetical protein